MGYNVVRFKKDEVIQWGIVVGEVVYPLLNNYSTLADFLGEGLSQAQALVVQPTGNGLQLKSIEILNPVTPPCNIVCQGKNYAAHRLETGEEAVRPVFNLFFSKASSALTSAIGKVIRPPHVTLLDYELELGLVIGRAITSAQEITEANLAQFVQGVVMVNDISARDVQVPQGQWFKGKSYRTFCPVGPYLHILDPTDLPQIFNLDLTLRVNGEIRQQSNTQRLLFSPAETLTELTSIMDLFPGDLVMTGTPEGVAMQIPGGLKKTLANIFLSEPGRMKLFVESQLKNPRYLKDGDVIEATICSPDGEFSLGKQVLQIVK